MPPLDADLFLDASRRLDGCLATYDSGLLVVVFGGDAVRGVTGEVVGEGEVVVDVVVVVAVVSS